jgi:hypothetical protein
MGSVMTGRSSVAPCSLRAAGEYVRAHELHEQALAMFQRVYERDHPMVATTLNNLAEDLCGLGDHAGTRELDAQALAMRQQLADWDVSTA